MDAIEPITLILDLIGLIVIYLYLFFIPKPVEFTFNREYGVTTSFQPIADAINSISRDFALIKRMQYGFFILVISLIMKLINWFIRYISRV